MHYHYAIYAKAWNWTRTNKFLLACGNQPSLSIWIAFVRYVLYQTELLSHQRCTVITTILPRFTEAMSVQCIYGGRGGTRTPDTVLFMDADLLL